MDTILVKNTKISKKISAEMAASAISEELVALNILLISAEEATRRLGYKAHSDGWWVGGVNPRTGYPYGDSYGQFKPFTPWETPKNPDGSYGEAVLGQGPKYRTSSLCEYGALAPQMPDPRYWPNLLANPDSTGVTITEGGKKALAGLSVGVPTVAVLGVTMWHAPGQPDKLVPEIEVFAQKGERLNLAFDSDWHCKPEVRYQLLKLGKVLRKRGCEVFIVEWERELKGMDDYISAKGGDAFRQRIADAKRIEEWERQFKKSAAGTPPGKPPVPPADLIAREVAEDYRDLLAFNNEICRWMRYGADGPGVWSAESDEFIESIVSSVLDARNITGYNSHSYIVNIVKKLRCLLIERKWLEISSKELLPFRNGVLEIATRKLLPHSPGHRLTWQLPRDFNPQATDWSGIESFLDHASGGNPAIKEILLCFCNAVLKGRSDLQRFLHLIGWGGTGKGTFTRILTALVGEQNICTSTLDDWCDNRFEAANAYRKRLVAFWDEDKRVGKLGKFKSLTGGDWLRGEEKGKKAFQFRFDGMVVVASNPPIFAGDTSSGLVRRIIPVPFNCPVAPSQCRNLDGEFQLELDAFTNYVLSIPDSRVTQVLTGVHDVPQCSLESWEMRMRTDSIAAWLNDCAIYDTLAVVPIGGDKEEGVNNDPRTLYGSYAKHCRQSGTSPKSSKNFSPDLLELCKFTLGWDVERKVTKTGKYVRGLRLRTGSDGGIPTHDYTLRERVTGDGSGDGSVTGAGDGSQSSQDKGFGKGDGSVSILRQKETDNSAAQNIAETVNYQGGVRDLPSPPAHPLQDKDCDPSPDPSPEPAPAPVTETSPAPAGEPAAAEPVDWPAVPVSEEIKGWAELLELAESVGDIRHLADHYRSFYGHDYDAQKKEVWQLLTAGTKERIRQLVAATEPATVTEQAAPEGIVSTDTPEPLATPAEAATLLTVAQLCLPDAAGPNLLALAKELCLDRNSKLWQALAQACSSPAPAPEKEPYSYRSFPHADPHAKEETRRSQARQGLNQLLKASKAKDFSALAAAFRRLNSAQLAWVAGNLLTQELRQNLWEMVRSWCRSKINPQRELF